VFSLGFIFVSEEKREFPPSFILRLLFGLQDYSEARSCPPRSLPFLLSHFFISQAAHAALKELAGN